MADQANATIERPGSSKRAKVISTALIFAALVLQLWQMLSALPPSLEPITNITAIVLIIHAVEGVISAVCILRYRLRGDAGVALSTSEMPASEMPASEMSASEISEGKIPEGELSENILTQKLPANTPLAVLKAGLYAFFVGTVGLLEVIEATKQAARQS